MQASYPQQKIHNDQRNTVFSVRGKKQALFTTGRGGGGNICIFVPIVLFILASEARGYWNITLGSPRTKQLHSESSIQAVPGRWNLALELTSGLSVQASLVCVYGNWRCSKYPLQDEPFKHHMEGAEFVLILLILPHRGVCITLDLIVNAATIPMNKSNHKALEEQTTCAGLCWLTSTQPPWGSRNTLTLCCTEDVWGFFLVGWFGFGFCFLVRYLSFENSNNLKKGIK